MKNSIFSGIPQEILKKRKKTAEPDFLPLMLATLTDEYFSSNDWIFEHKFDGVRCLVIKRNSKVQLMSRNRNIMNKSYLEIVHAFEKQKADNFIIDGEIVATLKGISDFELLQSRINLKDLAAIQAKTKEIPVALRIFDIMYVGGYDIRHLPLLERKQILKKLLNIMIFSPIRNIKAAMVLPT